MAATRIMPIHTSIADSLNYAMNAEKTENGKYISSFGCAKETVHREFELSQARYVALTGRELVHGIVAYQVRQAFKPGEIEPAEANRIGYEFAERFLKGKHAFIVCTHTNRHHIHNHIIWNAVDLECRGKFRNFKHSAKAIANLSDQICTEHELSVIENPANHGESYDKWLGDRKKPSNRDKARQAIDEVLQTQPRDYDGFSKLLADKGYSVQKNREVTVAQTDESGSVPLRERRISLDSLGKGYTVSDIAAVISGERVHTPTRSEGIGDASRGISNRDFVRSSVNEIMKAKRPQSFDELLRSLERSGYTVRRGKHISVKHKSFRKAVRIDSLGEGYTEADIRAAIAGERIYSPTSTDKPVKVPTNTKLLRSIIDGILQAKPKSFEEFSQALSKLGYTVTSELHSSLKHESFKRAVSLASLGEGYSEAAIRAVIAGERKHISVFERRAAMRPNNASRNTLLIDIEAKLREGKGGGYAHWAMKFNLKQMAKTMNYLRENNLLDYRKLTAKADDISSQCDKLKAEIANAEAAMAKNAILQTHITNYIKGRDVYMEYRMSGYSPMYYSAHEESINKTKEAKAYFDSIKAPDLSRPQRLPTIKSLRAEYGELLNRKKKAYAALKALREQKRELEIHKSNVDVILGNSAPKKQKHRDLER